jgi:PAS domain S-box-containing protein
LSKRALTISDQNFLNSVASQTAISIINTKSSQRIHESEKKYRELVESANSIIMRHNIEGEITFFNKFAQNFFDYKEEEIIGQNVIGTVMPLQEAAQIEFKNLIKFLTEKPEQPVVNENEITLSSGKTVWIAWTYRPIFTVEGNFNEVLCIGNDITELKIAEQEKNKLERRLIRAQKMEAIGTLAGGVAHDLNNILSGVVGYPELLLRDIPKDSSLYKSILTIQKSGEKAAAVVQDLLTLARRGIVSTEIVNLNNIITNYLKSPEHEILLLRHSNIEIECHFEKNLLNNLGSPVHLSKAIMNLIYNAAEAIKAKGTIILRTSNQYMDKSTLKYESVKGGEYVTLSVMDSGIGISSKDLSRIFEPFYTTKKMGTSGSGLGMAVIWGIVKDHNGYIDVKSVEGKGTKFTLYFPATRHEITKERSHIEHSVYKGMGESILVIDDIPEQRDIASEILSELNYVVKTVSSGEEALNYLKTHTVDLLILDMIMSPGMDGLETYQKIIEIHPAQKAIIVSGFSESDRVRQAQALGAGPYVKKPYLLKKISRVVRSELDR